MEQWRHTERGPTMDNAPPASLETIARIFDISDDVTSLENESPPDVLSQPAPTRDISSLMQEAEELLTRLCNPMAEVQDLYRLWNDADL